MMILAFINVLLSQKNVGGPIHIRSLGKGITDNEFSLWCNSAKKLAFYAPSVAEVMICFGN